ncbi:ArsR family transcriptional regulator [Amphritea opalescens]|uniref:ArsR family transcriptional regulator n=1 Tax=Amphritea opalescens TaxID=2490544 RepID=A0A430KN57_9GAMM|nr:metalloregulator ArsR/SmtB family transcription factor [Amphritea opalescens]RTE64927.1 ArsR family transcriptional regulator [Amphritea opalescens]
MNKLFNEQDESIAETAKALAHPARVKIIRLLLSKTSCVGGEITAELGLAQSTVSEHLRILKVAGIIVGEIEHPRVCYTLKPSSVNALASFLEQINIKASTAQTDDGLCCPLESPFEQKD